MAKFDLKQYSKQLSSQAILGVASLVLVGYYFVQFGLELPWENLYGDYSTRRYYSPYFGRVRVNVPLLPDKFVTILALGSLLIQLLLLKLQDFRLSPNPLTRLLGLVAIIGLFPLGIYLLTYASLLLFISIIGFVIYYIFKWILVGSRKNNNNLSN